MGDLLAATPETLMSFNAQGATVPGSEGALQAGMEEGAAFQRAHQAAFGRLQTFIAETNTRVDRHISVASVSGRDYLETDEVSAVNLDVTDFQMPR